MQRNLKILYVSSEIAPFVKSGNLADVASALPKALKDMGHDIRLFIPKYGTINDRKYTLREVIRLKDIKVPLHNKTVNVDVKSAFLPNTKVQVYFVENKHYFDRPELYINPDNNQEWSDNAERFIFFSRSIFEILRRLHWQPDIIHCNDWQTALIPFFLKHTYKQDPFFNKARTLLSMHGLSSQGIYDKNVVSLIDNPEEIFFPDSVIEFQGKVNFLKAGIICAELINMTSKYLVKEVLTSNEASFGLKSIFKKHSKKLCGLANGIDYTIWNPEIDTFLIHNYSRKDFTGKAKVKQLLVESLDLHYDENTPVIGTFSHLIDRYSYELLNEILEKMMKLNLKFIILNTGINKHQKMIQSFAKKYPEKMALFLKDNERFIHTMIAGCDIFLVPAIIEPYGSIHLSCLRYGTIPIVHATAGLLDAVKDFNLKSGKGYGFVFEEQSSTSLSTKIKEVVQIFSDRKIWKKLIDRAMKVNFSWHVVAEKYNKLYHDLITAQ